MGAYEPVHRGQRDANSHRTTAPATECSFCGDVLADGGERITHRLRTGGSERTVTYCSPSCFIREMEQVAGIGE